MKIEQVPKKFQPEYKSVYPSYSNGLHMEEIFFKYFEENKDSIETEYIYLPIFWTSFYILRNYAANINDLMEYLDKLDKSKKYFTIIQYASGICVKNKNLNLLVFSAGGGGINMRHEINQKVTIDRNPNRVIFVGKKADYDIPLMCEPLMKYEEKSKDIFCSFMGRLNTHNCRYDMANTVRADNRYQLKGSSGYDAYRDILSRSLFSLSPRGYGYTSFRIYEAIQMESIPIYVWDKEKVLPFSDEINWEEFCIIIHTSELNKLREIVDKADKSKMLEALKKYKPMFTFEETFKYMVRKLK